MLTPPGRSVEERVRRPRFELDSKSGRLVDGKSPRKSDFVSNLVNHIKAASSKMAKMVMIAEVLDDLPIAENGVGVQDSGGGVPTKTPCRA